MLNERSDPAIAQRNILAIDGGDPAIHGSIASWPRSDNEVKQSIESVFASGEWGKYTGTVVQQLSEYLGTYFLREHALLCSSGTIAVELALRAVNVRAGDEVIIAAYDFPGNFRAIEAVGAVPVLIDLCPSGWQGDIGQIADAISDKTSAVIASHLHGELMPIDALKQITSDNNLSLIEDACQCPGALVCGKKAGHWGDAAVISFGGSKLITAGRGGAVLTDNAANHQRMQIASDRGNLAYPLSQLQAAVLLPQFDQLDRRNEKRLKNARRVISRVEEFEWLEPLKIVNDSLNMPEFYKLPFKLTIPDDIHWNRDRVLAVLQAEGVPIDIGFRGFTKRSSRRCRKIGDCMFAEIASETTILLHHPILLECDDMIDQLIFAFEKTNRAIMRID